MVHGPAGRQDAVIENAGEVTLDLGNDRRTQEIGEGGRTNFAEIPRQFLEKPIGLSVKAESYELAHPDSTYTYNGEPIYLAITPDRQLVLTYITNPYIIFLISKPLSTAFTINP